MDLFGDDIDTMLGDDDLNQNIREDDAGENEDDNQDDMLNKNGDFGDSVPVEPKKRSIRNPQVSKID